MFADNTQIDTSSNNTTSQARVFYLRSGSGEDPGSLWSREPQILGVIRIAASLPLREEW